MKLLNAFSIQMCSHLDEAFSVSFAPVSEKMVKTIVENKLESFIGHADTANILSNVLGVTVEFNRQFVRLERGETALIAQYCGTRLPEGATELPEGASFKWFLVTIK